MRALARRIDHATCSVCQGLLGLLVLGLLAGGILRYVFGVGFIELQDAVAYAFAALVVLSVPGAQASDTHVRVDVLRGGQVPWLRDLTDRAGIIGLLLPVYGLTIWYVWPDIAYSWSIREGSVETGGLPGLFVVKSALPLACALMILQGLARLAQGRPVRG